MIVHQQTGSSHGTKTTRCGVEGREGKNGFSASGWASDVTCPDCLDPPKKENHP